MLTKNFVSDPIEEDSNEDNITNPPHKSSVSFSQNLFNTAKIPLCA